MFNSVKRQIFLFVIVMAVVAPTFLYASQKSILDLLPFSDPASRFQCLWRFGNIASGGGDFGEMLTAAKEVTDKNHESWHQPWVSMADRPAALASEYLRTGNLVSAQAAFFRAANYYRTSEIYLSPVHQLGSGLSFCCFLICLNQSAHG